MPRPRSPKSKDQKPAAEKGPVAGTQQRSVSDLMGPADPNAPTRVMRPGGEDLGPRPGRPTSEPAAGDEHPPVPRADDQGGDVHGATGHAAGAGGGDLSELPRISGLGSGLLARQPTPVPGGGVSARKVCPHCGNEYETDARFCPKDGAALRPTGGSDPLIGHTLGDRYHILSLVGEGGMGRIYLAEHVRMNRQCAVKIMRPNLVNDADAAARFAREASSAARIIHPNVAAVFDYGESDGHIYLVMEYVNGESLGAILQTERVLAIPRAVALGCQIADALSAAHELGIVHRDLKPDNILITRTAGGKEVAKVVDFGIAKAIKEGPGQKLTETGLVIGTPEFMSPEQLMGDPVDARSDIYSLGCILYLMLVGVPAADAPTREGMLKRRLNESAPHPRSANETLPPELDDIVAKSLATAAADRQQSAAELRDALAAVAVPPVDAVPVGIPDPSSPTQQMPSGRTTARRFPSRRHGVGASVLVLGAVAMFLMGRDWGGGASDATMVSADSVASIPQPTIGPVPGTLPPDTMPAAGKSVLTTGEPVRTPAQVAADSVRADSARRARAAAAELRRALEAPVRQFVNALSSRDIARLKAAYPGLTPAQERGWNTNFTQFSRIDATPRIGEPETRGSTASLDFTVRVVMSDNSGQATTTNLPYTALYDRAGGRWVLREFRQQP